MPKQNTKVKKETCQNCGSEHKKISKKHICSTCGREFCSFCCDCIFKCSICGKRICEFCAASTLDKTFKFCATYDYFDHFQKNIDPANMCVDCFEAILDEETFVLDRANKFIGILKKKRRELKNNKK